MSGKFAVIDLISGTFIWEIPIKTSNDSIINGDSVFIPVNNWAGVAPRENLVAGFNFETALDNRNIIFQLA